MTLVVNGEKVDDSAIQQEADRLRPDYERVFAHQDPVEREAQLLDWSKENVIERVLINQHAKNHGPAIPAAQIQSALEQIRKKCGTDEQFHKEFGTNDEREIKEHIELHLKVERMLKKLYEDLPEPTEDETLKFYNENKEQFKSPEQIRVAHIVKHINGQTSEVAACSAIEKAQNELKNGAIFETLVAKYSDCPQNGGDLGYIAKGQMVEEFEDVAFNLAVNRVSGVFRTRFGFHIAKLYDRKPQVVRPLEQVKDSIAAELKKQMREKAIDDFVDRLKADAKIEEI
ncbi:MAG: peptidylprolyl isomerase [Planctomycetota bacterium]|nr:MAG: peptidylprolyl isomerase [Planctomycetota bacterium]